MAGKPEEKKHDEDKWKGMPDMTDRDEAEPGTPGTGEVIDPKTGERYTEGIGGG